MVYSFIIYSTLLWLEWWRRHFCESDKHLEIGSLEKLLQIDFTSWHLHGTRLILSQQHSHNLDCGWVIPSVAEVITDKSDLQIGKEEVTLTPGVRINEYYLSHFDAIWSWMYDLYFKLTFLIRTLISFLQFFGCVSFLLIPLIVISYPLRLG